MIDHKSRYLILGKEGMLGHDLQQVFHDRDYIALGQDELDLTKPESIKTKILEVQPDVVINAAGYTNVDKAEDEELLAEQINGYSVGVLAAVCRDFGVTMVHFSSDYVFDGTKESGYDEEDIPHPLNAYGRSKKLGEELLMEEMESENPDKDVPEGKYFLIRTSWLHGKRGINFIEKIIAKSHENKPWKVIADQHGSFTYAPDLARQIKWLVESGEYESGIYHITNSGTTTWYEIAKTVLAKFGKADLISPCKTEEFKLKAERPRNSVLLNTKLPNLRDWKEALGEYLG